MTPRAETPSPQQPTTSAHRRTRPDIRTFRRTVVDRRAPGIRFLGRQTARPTAEQTAAVDQAADASLELRSDGASAGGTFAALRTRNFRLFASGQIFSNTGAWVQRIAQDWLVLSITHSATDVGITTMLQFLPTLLFGLFGGMIADRYPKRRVLIVTNAAVCLTAATLAFLVLSHRIEVWHVWTVAFLFGMVISVDNPVRQSFVNEMVGPEHLRNAISLNASVFQLGALIGPAISGALITAVGPGWSFLINSISYLAPVTAISLMRTSELQITARPPRRRGQLAEAIRYVRAHSEIRWPIVLVGSFGVFTINLPVTLASYANSVFHSGAGGYGTLSSVVACGSLIGALITAHRTVTRLRVLAGIAAALSAAYIVASMLPDIWAYGVLLVLLGSCTLMFLTTANSIVQIAASDEIRGRVMGIYMLVFIGSGAFGGPLIGFIDQHAGPRAGMLVSGLVPGVVLVAVAVKLARSGQLRLAVRSWSERPHLLAVVPR